MVHRASGAQPADCAVRPRRAVGPVGHGANRDRAGPPVVGGGSRSHAARCSGSRTFRLLGDAPLDLDALAAAILQDSAIARAAVPRLGAPRRQALPLTSPQIEREVGGRIKEARGWRVDLDDAELTIHLEMLTDHAFYFFGKEPGAGGLPTGTGGRVACLLSGGIDSPVAAYRMMRRGCAVTFVHFHSYPILSRASQEKVRELVAAADDVAAAVAAATSCRSASCSSRSCWPCPGRCAWSSIGG